ncbi:MAG: hypothetical protein K0S32_3328 [Bacteroidetes bacterium]|jgi:uncharacterized protein YtpQ (UPF0354 family)|nr:hypothetical protein [Bacteroidota bacterium]
MSEPKDLSTIYPYFKQFLHSHGNAEPLPDDFSNIDKSKTYEASSFRPVIRNVSEDLNCLYAFDTHYGYDIILESTLKEMNMTKEQLHEIAMENFRKLLQTNMKIMGDKNALMITVNGNLEAGMVLVDEIWDQLEEIVGEEVVIAVPSRDVIVATGKSNREMIDNFRAKGRHILATASHPISKNFFVRNNKKWELLEEI